jgi:adenylyltransferase/sulfurtransferase
MKVVREARALVVGAGALGNEVVKNLAMMGVKAIVVLDRDVVEVANLTRSVFFREADHGAHKAEVLAQRLRELNSDVGILPLCGDVDDTLGLGLVRRMDLIFSCLDNRLARRAVNRLCQKMARPWVDGSMENLLGDVTVYLPDEGPCYECTLNALDLQLMAQATSCKGIALQNLRQGKVPTVSTMGSIIGALQVQEAVKLLHGEVRRSLAGGRLVVNCQINDYYVTRAERHEDCPGHFRYGEITEVPQWTSAETTARELLDRFAQETGQPGYLQLGREVTVGLTCRYCRAAEQFEGARNGLSVEQATCPRCGELRSRVSVNVIHGAEEQADWPLARLGVPRLEVLEVRGAERSIWYELTGDWPEFSGIL